MRAVYILCHMMMRVVDRVVEPEGLTGSRWHLMIVVRDGGEPLTITQLSERLFLSPQNVSRMVSALESEGLVERDTSGPGRTVRVALTDRGSAQLGSCGVLAACVGQRMVAGTTPADMRRTIGMLEHVITNTAAIERELARPGPADHTKPAAGGATEPKP
jgi:DNA-binding MarR family transcriptional regulator